MHFLVIRLVVCNLTAAATVVGIALYCWAEAECSRLAFQKERETLEAVAAKQKLFRAEMTRVFADLKEDRLSLSDAVDRLEQASRQNCPGYVKQLAAKKKFHSLREAIADNIVRHFSVVAMKKCAAQRANEEVLARLKTDQTNLFSEPQTQVVIADH